MWNGAVVAESDDVVRVEGYDYFPANALRWDYMQKTSTRSLCPWKGIASYYDVAVDGVVNPRSAWSYARPLPFARRIKGRVAFWRGIEIVPLGGRDS